MRAWVILFLIGVCYGAWTGRPVPAYAYKFLDSITVPSTTVATDGEFIAWTVPAGQNNGKSAVFARPLQDGASAPSTLIASEPQPEIATLLLSEGIVVWATSGPSGKQTLRGRNLRGGDTLTVATDALRPAMSGSTLFWWQLQGQAGPGGTATLMRHNLSTQDAPQALHQLPYDLAYPGPIRASDRWVAWTRFQGLAYGSAIWSLYALSTDDRQERLVQANIGCSDSNGYERFVLSGDNLVYSSASCYRGPQNDGTLTILDLASGQRQVSGPHNNLTLSPVGRYIFWHTYRQQDSTVLDLWGFDPHTLSAFALGSDITPLTFRNGMLFWSKHDGEGTTISSVPLPQVLPTAPRSANDPAVAGRQYFRETGHTLAGSFRDYWTRNGGLSVFGFPLTEEFVQQSPDADQGYPVQYFERQRFEYHSEHRGTAYEVLLGRLGAEALSRSGRDWQSFPKASPDTAHYFAQTGQAIAPEFWGYWRSHGLELGDRGVSERESLALWGLPISPAQPERLETGEILLVQWFERARFEYHPFNPEPYKVLLGRLAAETVDSFGWQ